MRLARSWIGTPFVHQGRTRGVKKAGRKRLIGGVDCAGLIIMVGQESGLLDSSIDVPAYDRFPDGTTIRKMLAEHTVEIGLRDVQPGDVVAMRWAGSRFPHHMGWISSLSGGRLGLIHSAFAHRRVVECGFEEPWLGRTVSCHTFPTLKDVRWPD